MSNQRKHRIKQRNKAIMARFTEEVDKKHKDSKYVINQLCRHYGLSDYTIRQIIRETPKEA